MTVIYNQSGYVGTSMSVRAQQAYEMGEKPLSKWKKGEILSLAKSAYGETFSKAMSKRPLFQLKDELLSGCGWHHTSAYLNETGFYAFDPDKDEGELNEILSHPVKKAPRKAIGSEKWAVGFYSYTENRGTRNYPNIYDCQDTVLVHWKEGQKGRCLPSGKIIYNFTPSIVFDKKPRKNAKALKLVGNHSESRRK